MIPIQVASEHEAKVHQVTLVQVSVTEEERGVPGALTLQLMVNKELKEYVVRAAPGDAAVLVEFLTHGTSAAPAPEAPLAGERASSAPWGPSRRWAEASLMKT